MNTTDTLTPPSFPDLQKLDAVVLHCINAFNDADAESLSYLNTFYTRSDTSQEFRQHVQQRLNDDPGQQAVSLLDSSSAQKFLARLYGFADWPNLIHFTEEMARPSSMVSHFESAVDAIITGDINKVKLLLEKFPTLIHMRSLRAHEATLFNYLGANGVENYRQRTPPGIIAIAKLLLDNGADVDATCGAYGKGSTLGLIASSYHPYAAGVQLQLLKILIDAGASVDNKPGEWNPTRAALRNGRGEAAAFLADQGARLNLESALGTGNLEIAKTYFHENGHLIDEAMYAQMKNGFSWACQYGKTNVVEFLLDNRFDIHSGERIDMTGLHWAIVGAQPELVQRLLQRGARLDAENVYGGNALNQAFWAFTNSDDATKFIAVFKKLLDAGAVPAPGTINWLNQQTVNPPEAKNTLREMLVSYGAGS